MSASVRSLIIAFFGLILALFFGSLLGQGSWTPALIAGSLVLVGGYIIFFRTIRLEAIILTVLLSGYIIGNRGFAQLSFTQNTPLYLGEAGMVVCLALLASRVALKHERLIPRTALSGAITIFLALGAVRLAADIFLKLSPAATMVTIRDSATVYYAAFFFIAYKVGFDPIGRRLIERCILAACIVLLPVFLIEFVLWPDLFDRFTFRGYPLIAQKGDLTATYLAFASFYFFLYPARGLGRVMLRLLAILFFLGILVVTARSAIFGYACAAGLLLLARRPQFVFYQTATVVAALLLAGLMEIGGMYHQNSSYSRVADKLESMTDVSGNHSYRGETGDYAIDNNQFRIVWWRSVFDETLKKGPFFGLGFGYDLSAGFLRNYYSNQFANWDTRSPHSIWVTVLGRMGFLGLLSFTTVVFLVVRESISAARKVARGREAPNTLAFWIGALIILGSASFGVVLEGPMGGILFWSFLGLAASQTEIGKAKEVPAATAPAPKLPRELALAD
jgi:O-Antigen ligase